MFTGITEQVGRIESLHIDAQGGALLVHLPSQPGPHLSVADGMKLGDSISVNGCCLTVTHFDPMHFSAQLSGETLQRTNFGEKKPRDLVNLERPLAAGARLGGHFMQGHVDGVGRVTRVGSGRRQLVALRARSGKSAALRRGKRFDRDRRHQFDGGEVARRHRRHRNHSLHPRKHQRPHDERQ